MKKWELAYHTIKMINTINPITAGVAYIRVFIFLLAH